MSRTVSSSGAGRNGRGRQRVALAKSRELDVNALTLEHELLSPRDLPDLEGGALILEWDFDDGRPGDRVAWTVIRHNGVEIFREIAIFEGLARYDKVREILRRRYGPRLRALHPTKASLFYLHGDARL